MATIFLTSGIWLERCIEWSHIMKTPKQLNAEYDALAIPISKHMMKNHYKHWGNFPHELSRMTPEWISKCEALGYCMDGIKALRSKMPTETIKDIK
tara:strand:- start:33118 stop:33405 length:288 start_codon:yes stop_codon:yes gene_type:complete